MNITTKTLFKSGYANNSTIMIQQIMIYEMEAQYMSCALVYACLDSKKWIDFEFI